MNTTLKLGLIGSSITLALNLFGTLVLKQHAARFFTDDWWSTWFPSFIVWLGITIVGLGRQLSGRRREKDARHS
jgi:hypothetical protein